MVCASLHVIPNDSLPHLKQVTRKKWGNYLLNYTFHEWTLKKFKVISTEKWTGINGSNKTENMVHYLLHWHLYLSPRKKFLEGLLKNVAYATDTHNNVFLLVDGDKLSPKGKLGKRIFAREAILFNIILLAVIYLLIKCWGCVWRSLPATDKW